MTSRGGGASERGPKPHSGPPTAQEPATTEHGVVDHSAGAYWHANLRVVGRCLVIWFAVSFGCGILLVDVLDQIRIGGFGLGFWFAQQGSIWVFLALIGYYAYAMHRIDRRFDVDDDVDDDDMSDLPGDDGDPAPATASAAERGPAERGPTRDGR